MTAAPSRPVLRYHGGKFRLAPWVLSHLPPHRVYCEPFCGAASILMQKSPAPVEVINDLNDSIVNLFRVLRDPEQSCRLEEMLRLTPYARTEYYAAMEPYDESDPVEEARRVIIRAYMGFGAASLNTIHRSGFRVKWSSSYVSSSNSWCRYPDAIARFCERLQGVTIENKPALEIIAQYNRGDVLLYLDPPYVAATRNMAHPSCRYCNDMDDADHRVLAEALRASKSMVVLSGYPSTLYDELYGDWRRVTTQARIEHGQERTEVLWFNGAATERLQGVLPL